MRVRRFLGCLVLSASVSGAAAQAHEGVLNPAVKLRMDLMVEIGKATGTLGAMARGKVPFDAGQAEAARQALEAQASKIPELFHAAETDKKSEALPVIWSDWSGFTIEAEAMRKAAAAMDTSALTGVQAGLGGLGKSCSSCHTVYRQMQ